ncbi:MAG TPA: HIT domain-containing protein [Dehalococcoidia bacterium]|nr:HIT domain-containing protein [Dehalococcoidia bacterium]HLC30400.1 HIT domain-containing protein [Dehalococcoidia bacterium]
MYCTFCNIIARKEPADIRYEDDEVIVFENLLRWVPVMLLVVPKKHLSQEELWQNIGPVARVATEMGNKYCPNGFRLLSNFGHNGMQSQPHGHVHVLGGVHLGLYV